MPELPEVAGLAGFLDEQLRGCVVTKLQVVSFAVLKTADPPFDALEGRTVSGVRRFGKFISIDTGGISLVFHLARAGWVRFTDSPADSQLRMGKGLIAVRCAFSGPNGPRGLDLTEAGTKKSLAVYVVRDPQEVPGIASLGPDPFTEAFDADMLAEILGGSSQQIKGLLRSQSVIAGIGNAYSDEILHAARISPFAIAKSLDRESVQVLYEAIHSVLGEALKEAAGKPPKDLKDVKRSHMRVHARAGQPCPVCGDTVREVSFADTALQYCPTCQTKGKILADRRTSKFLK
ncbi:MULTISPECIES: Fpg/Nei family DNA glycosylase [Pseudarthrobacter]|uniref:Formamidopyrimidine-DNA glycosylase n=1 Tax=Pseudarthrobacter niigatensis TaxID=369935 RepID=A0AAJ1WEQ1_9MICC|nr:MULTISPECIES: DNA-formamidopyrimidine glycosylase family protein [Pseudarthrobacter]MDQ0147539.1 formamidopyrimidine-DNA glycosylase [Pseudarthrobacter niigatensis]MDQ0267480.1 formamidopyrimidine-DNA glycosylase [Pseudarthrobacter niigatensis]QDG63989.1 Fpg/Nei family DNA glycosylase [Pseudarthrobacter sp. NIBRBAC000502771]QDG87922.1 Fpg/Nei family DNA glycosylase [Pseudarthrobacter sp. NIBRBAC000502770]